MVFRANRYLLPNLLFERAYMIDSKLSILCVRVLAYPGTIYWPVVLGQHRDWNINSNFFSEVRQHRKISFALGASVR